MSGWPTRSIDTDPHPRFRVYSSGNFGEVAPDRLSILSWSLVGPPSERGFRAFVERFWPRATWHLGSHHVFVGYFAGKPYHNLSALAHLAAEVPWVHPEDLAAMYFEDVEVPQQDHSTRAGPLAVATLVARIVREFSQLRSRLVEVEARVAAIERSARRALSDGAPTRLGIAVERARPVLDAAWSLHMTNTTWLVPAHATQRLIANRVDSGGDDLSGWLNRPQELVWGSLYETASIDRSAPGGGFLDHSFYELADDREPFASLAIRHSVGDTAVAEGDGLDGGERIDIERALWDILPTIQGAPLRGMTRVISDAMEAREASKSLAMRGLHVFRTLVPPMAESLGVSDEDWPYLTIEELCSGRSSEFSRLAADRRQALAAGIEIEMPTQLDLTGTSSVADAVRNARPAKPAAERGRGVSPGAAEGIAVTPESIDSFEPTDPKILVCASADADVEPLLPRVRGVVSGRGSVLSHISILVREHGLPGVVGHPLALTIEPGTRISIDGTSGDIHLRADGDS